MFSIPDSSKRLLIPNNSDLFGNIHYTKNINLDEDGYIKLSHRSVNLGDTQYDAQFGTPVSIGRYSTGRYHIVTNEVPFELQLDNSATSIAEDINASGDGPPTFTLGSSGLWWQGKWHVTSSDGKLYSKANDTGNWTDHSISLVTSKLHSMDIFRERQTLCIANGNTVMQLNTSYSTSGIPQLTIPDEYEITGLKHSNNRIGIVTKLSNTAVEAQSSDAYFFVWDGATTGANQAFPIGSDMALGIIAYKSSWLIITRTGNALYWNGNGFQLLFSLPFYFLDLTWGDSINLEAFTDFINVDGDNIYFNLNCRMAEYGMKGEKYVPTQPAGILCYNPKVGLHHKFAPSISKATFTVVPSSNVNTTTGVLTQGSGFLHTGAIPPTGNQVKYVYDSTDQIGGLKTGSVYYVIRHTATQFSLAETYADAFAGNRITLTSTGADNNHFLFLDVVDYGATQIGRTGGIVQTDKNTHVSNRLLYGMELYPKTTSSVKKYINAIVAGFKNIGYFVTPKIQGKSVQDTIQKVYIKYKPLKTADSIVIKEKTKDIIGLPVSTPQNGVHCTWTSANTFTTTADFSEALTYLTTADASLECEIISGSGAGNLIQVTSIEESAGTYTVTLGEDVEGVDANDICDVLLENWRVLGTVTSDDIDGYMEYPSGASSKWAKYKVILIGDNVIIEELNVVNSTHKPTT